MLELLLALALPIAPAQAGLGGNVCVIVIDDVGPGLLGCYDEWFRAIGRPSATPASTPAIDTLLAANGLSFTRAWSNPTCTPSRAAMLTGRYGHRSGIGRVLLPRIELDNPGLEPTVELLPELLHAAVVPYTCAAVGKWHLASDEQIALYPTHPLGVPAGRWFDRQAGTWFNLTAGTGTPFQLTGYYMWDKAYATRIRASESPCASGEPPCIVEMDVNLDPHDYPTVDTIDDAIALVQELPEPWFLWISANAAHGPAHGLPAGLPSDPCSLSLPPGPTCSYPGLATAPSQMRCMLEALDQQLGRLFCEIDFQDTTVILTSDNGTSELATVAPYTTDHAKGSVYQGGVEVPLIVRSPLLAPQLAGTHSGALVSLVDLFATVQQLALAPASVRAVDSLSLLPLMRGAPASTRRSVYAEVFGPNFIPDPVTGGPPAGYAATRHDQALRERRFKLIRKWRPAPGGGAPLLTEELYDLVAGGPPDTSTQPPTPRPDWLEQNDLLASGAPLVPVAQQALVRLRRELDVEHPTLVQ